MSAARPLSSLLSASLSGAAVVALTLAAPGTALADPGQGAESRDKGAAASGGHGKSEPAAPATQRGSGERKQSGSTSPAAKRQHAAPDKPAKDKRSKPAQQPAQQPATAADTGSSPASGDPAGNNGTIKIDTVPGDPDRANRPHPGCAFVVQFFNFDADQHADITFTGQAPTRSAGPLWTDEDRAISTSPADGTLEEGHSLVLTADDLGLVNTPTAAKGWHVKVAVDVIGAPGGAKQKVFWLDCATGEAIVGQEPDEADVAGAGTADEVEAPSVVEQGAADRPESESADGVSVLSGTADRDVAVEDRAVDGVAARVQDAARGRSTTATLASVLPFAVPAALPFTGAAGVTGMLLAGLGAVAAGALALRAGRRRTTG